MSCGSNAVSLKNRLDVPRQERLKAFGGARLRQVLKEVEQVGVRLETIGASATDE